MSQCKACELLFYSKQRCSVKLYLKGSTGMLRLPHAWVKSCVVWIGNWLENIQARSAFNTSVKRNPLIVID